MQDLRQPLDFERLPEFRQLVAHLARRAKPDQSPKLSEASAHFLWSRLFVELGLLAQSNNRPGYLTGAEAALYETTVDGLFGDDCRPIALLTEARILVEENGELFAPWFAKLNSHLAGDFVTKEERGNVASAISRQQKRLEIEAVAQGTLLPVEVYRTRDGQPMPEAERNRALVIIRNLDNCLGAPQRRPLAYTEGLMADAHAVAVAYDNERLKKFYVWLALNKAKPNIPRAAEQVLRDFETFHAVSLVK